MTPRAAQLGTQVFDRLPAGPYGAADIVEAIRGECSPSLCDGLLAFVPSLIPGHLALVSEPLTQGIQPTPQELTRIDHEVIALLAAGVAGLLDAQHTLALAQGDPGVPPVRDLDWGSVVLAPLAMPGHAAGAILFWRQSSTDAFTDHEVAALRGLTSLCAPMILSVVLSDHLIFGRDLIEALPEAVIAVDPQFIVFRWNAGAERLYGIPAADAIGNPLATLYSTFYDDPDMDRDRAWEELLRNGRWDGVVTQQSKAGRTVSVAAAVTLLRDDDAKIIGAVATNRDNSEIVRARSRLDAAERLLADALSAAGAMSVVLDEEATIVAANREWLDTALVNTAPLDQVSVGADYLAPVRKAADAGDADALSALDAVVGVLSGARPMSVFEYRCDRPDGPHWYQMEARRLGSTPGAVITHREVTERHHLESRLAHGDTHDSLTGLGNRILLETRITRARFGESHNGALGLLICDVDGFASVNETLGYSGGDSVLRVVADRIRAECPPTFLTVRLGADQFAIFAESVTDPMVLQNLAEHLRVETAQPIEIGGRRLRVSLSIGMALLDPQEQVSGTGLSSELIARADAARIDSKLQGRNRVRRYVPAMRDQSASIVQLQQDFSAALTSGDLELHYQQIRSLADEAVVGFEALVRWPRPLSPTLTPATFGTVLASPLVAGPLARWSISVAVHDALALQSLVESGLIEVGINISAQQFIDVDVASLVTITANRAGLPTSAIVVEVTETTAFTDDTRVHDQLLRLHERGVSVSLDDFGTGFSSLAHLRALPVDSVKIDKSFTSDIGTDVTSEALVRSLIGLAHDLGLVTVAEGVETQEQADWLRANHCDRYQGFLAHRPSPLIECLGD